MENKDRRIFETKAYEFHKSKLNNLNLRRSDFKVQLRNFLKKKTVKISISNLNSYLFALNELDESGAKEAIFKSEIKSKTNNWRYLLIKITSDLPLPKETNPSHLDEISLKELKGIMKNIVRGCSAKEIDNTRRRLKMMREYTSEFISKN